MTVDESPGEGPETIIAAAETTPDRSDYFLREFASVGLPPLGSFEFSLAAPNPSGGGGTLARGI
jgi:hypothetical protein